VRLLESTVAVRLLESTVAVRLLESTVAVRLLESPLYFLFTASHHYNNCCHILVRGFP